ncbi:MAG: hypothetical protein MUE69_14930 [Myxococcota bacterium]|nr:hypothetical protein [Myxococcota bacterium]
MSDVPTRELAALRCKECSAVVLVDGSTRELVCLCGGEVRVPKRVADDLELGRVLPKLDVEREVREATDAVVEASFEMPLPPRLVLGGLAVIGAVIGGVVWSRAGGSVPLGVVVGLALGVLPVGFASQWLATIALGRAVTNASAALRGVSLECPKCAVAIARPTGPGVVKCPSCHEELVVHPEVVVLRGGDRREPLRTEIRERLEGQAFFAPRPLAPGDWAIVLGVWAMTLATMAIAKLGAPFVD